MSGRFGKTRVSSAMAAVALVLALTPLAAHAAPEDTPPGVDPELVEAVERDLGMTWDEYVAQGELAADAADAADAPGVDEVRVEDDQRVVVVGEGAEAQQAADEVGAELESPEGLSIDDVATAFVQEVDPTLLVAVVSGEDGPILQVTEQTDEVQAFAAEHGVVVETAEQMRQTARPGEYWRDQNGSARCSIGFGGFDARGNPVMGTAAHCTTDGALRTATFGDTDARGTLQFGQFGGPGNAPQQLGHDVAAYRMDRRGAITPWATTWGGSLPITGMASPVSGAGVCAGGASTQTWSCSANTRTGVAWVPGFGDDDARLVQGLQVFGMNTRDGDSGTGYFMGTRLVGVLSGGAGSGAGAITMVSGLDPLTERGYTVEVALEQATAPVARPGTRVTGTVPRSSGAARLPAKTQVLVSTGSSGSTVGVDKAGRFSFTAPSAANEVVNLQTRSGHSRAVTRQWNALVGSNTTGRFCGLKKGGCGQHFQGGSVYWASRSGTPHVVHGAIRGAWAQMGWERGWLGYPTGEERCGLVGGGCWQTFEGGRMYWSPATGAHAVRGEIGNGWNRLGFEWGKVGYPTGPEICGLVRGGCFQRFQHGAMYWSPGTGAHWVNGLIQGRWGDHAWERGRLGYPTTSEICGLRRGGCFTHFEGGSIYWTPSTGAQPVWGEIRRGWAHQGWEHGRWGYPVGPERCSTRGGFHCTQRFQGGTVHWDPRRGARLG